MSDCRKCCVSDFKDALCDKDFCEKYYREGSAEDFEKLLPHRGREKRMSDQLKITLHHPITEEEWDAIADVDFDYTDKIFFHTKHGKKVEFVKRKKGKWMPHIEKSREYIGTVLVNVWYDYWFCDACGYRVENGQPLYNFCPNCGADMRGEKDEAD